MSERWGEVLGLKEVSDWIGSDEQLARIEQFTSTNGPSTGLRTIKVDNGGGLTFDLLPDRALDLGYFAYRGVPLVWVSGAGFGGPDVGAGPGRDWLRRFGGGLLMTCGLDSFGVPSTDEFGEAGLHGSFGRQRARITRAEVADDEVLVEAVIRQVTVFGEFLELKRQVTSSVGSSSLMISDEVANRSDRSWPHMVLYHMNFGWPLVGPGAVLEGPFSSSEPRDEVAAAGLATHLEFQEPTAGYAEQVFTHELDPTAAPAKVVVRNPDLGIAVEISLDPSQLPYLHHWKMMGVREYALGVEPSNCEVMGGRVAARTAGKLPVLEPGETRRYQIKVNIARL